MKTAKKGCTTTTLPTNRWGSSTRLKKSIWNRDIMKKKYAVEKISYFVVYATIIFATVFVTEAVHGAELVEAEVVSSEPVYYEVVNKRPQRICRDVLVPIERHRSGGGSIGRSVERKFGSTGGLIGAILGGGLGSRVGEGKGKTLATITGVVIGARVGDRIEQNRRERNAEYKTVNHCETVFTEETFQKVDYYRVTVEVDGIYTTTNAKRQPAVGSNIKVLMK